MPNYYSTPVPDSSLSSPLEPGQACCPRLLFLCSLAVLFLLLFHRLVLCAWHTVPPETSAIRRGIVDKTRGNQRLPDCLGQPHLPLSHVPTALPLPHYPQPISCLSLHFISPLYCTLTFCPILVRPSASLHPLGIGRPVPISPTIVAQSLIIPTSDTNQPDPRLPCHLRRALYAALSSLPEPGHRLVSADLALGLSPLDLPRCNHVRYFTYFTSPPSLFRHRPQLQ